MKRSFLPVIIFLTKVAILKCISTEWKLCVTVTRNRGLNLSFLKSALLNPKRFYQDIKECKPDIDILDL